MPFGSPTVQNRSGEILGSAFQNAIANYLGRKQQKRQEGIQDEERTRANAIQDYQLGQQGVHLLKPGEMAPNSVFQDIVGSAIQDHPLPTGDEILNPKPAATVAPQGAPADSDFQSMIAAALKPTASSAPRYEFGRNYYVDRQAAADNAARSSDIAANSEYRKALIGALPGMMTEGIKRQRILGNLTAAGVPSNMAGAAADNPTLAADLLKPTPDKKDEQIRKRITELVGKGVKLDAANQQARLEFGEQNQRPQEISPSLKFGTDQANKILDDYARDTKDFHQVMAGWDVLQGATKNPSLATPFALTDAYARITNPGAIVRPTTMEMIEHMGSVGQRMRKWIEKNENGALPPDIVRDFQRTLYGIVQEHKNQYDQIRAKAIKRGSDAGVNVSPYLEDYTLENPLGSNAQQQAWDAAAAALKKQGKKPEDEIGPRP